jgi:hypothetical protein
MDGNLWAKSSWHLIAAFGVRGALRRAQGMRSPVRRARKTGDPTAVMTASWCRAALWKLRGELSTGRLVGWNSCQACGWIVDAPNGERRVSDGAVLIIFPLLRTQTKESSLSLFMHRVRVLIIMANSETEMIFTPR